MSLESAITFSGVLAMVLGMIAGVEVYFGIYRVTLHQKFVTALLGIGDTSSAVFGKRPAMLSVLMRRGCVFLRPVARYMLRATAVDNSVSQMLHTLEAHDFESDKEAILSLLLAVSVGVSVIVGVITASVVCGCAVGCCACIGALGFVRNQGDKQNLAMRESVPEALRSMGTCFRSGLSLVQTLRNTAHEIGGALGDLFDVAARRLEMGASTTDALAILRGSNRVPELVFVSVALDVQHQSGGSIAPVLESARESVESELELTRSLRVQTAQARLSARIVTLMPFILLAFFSLMSPDFLTPFFTSIAGIGLLALALVMEVAGVLSVRRILRVETG